MSNGPENCQLIVVIDRMLREIPDAAPAPSICRVSDSLRSTSGHAYDPLVISIGPLHHGKDHLKAMEQEKKRCLKKLVGQSGVAKYVDAVWKREQEARKFYAEEIDMKANEFVQMLLLDGIFVIQFLRETYLDSDHSSQLGHVNLILRDLILLENQIPLLVLEDLFHVSENNSNNGKFIRNLVWPFLQQRDLPEDLSTQSADHLLGLVHHATTSSFAKRPKTSSTPSKVSGNGKMENVRSASELRQAGIVFKKVDNKDTSSRLDITFKNKTIYIPELEISDVTESWFKNMIAYEYYLPGRQPKYVTDYAFLLHCLVQSSNDAELLRRRGIINNLLGGDARVYEMIERMGTNAQPSEELSNSDVIRSVNEHYMLKRNWWVALLRRNHFNNPWTIISLVAAVILLTAAVTQTLYTVLSYYRDSRRE